MGMDVYGKAPASETGEYFRNNVWWWRPLANYILETAPEALTEKRPHWHTNDGAGLDAADSRALADLLQAEIDSGRCASYAAIRDAEQKALPREKCTICDGTGIRMDEIGMKMRQPAKVIDAPGHPRHGETGWCNGCDGHGWRENSDAMYPFSVENVQEFVNFLRDSGGFEIN